MGRPTTHHTTVATTAKPAPGRIHPLAALAAGLLGAIEGELNRLDYERRFGPHGVAPSCNPETVSNLADETEPEAEGGADAAGQARTEPEAGGVKGFPGRGRAGANA